MSTVDTISIDDTFDLYDLRVEVICPPGERIMCGAKEGDYFTLEGEMLHLPPGQGFSIYSLGMDPSNIVYESHSNRPPVRTGRRHPPIACCETESNTP